MIDSFLIIFTGFREYFPFNMAKYAKTNSKCNDKESWQQIVSFLVKPFVYDDLYLGPAFIYVYIPWQREKHNTC
jgi:hypothetical protein